MPGGEKWDYKGLHILETGDYLKIFAPGENSEKIYWEGKIALKTFSLFTEHASGMWIHSEQETLERGFWAIPFLHEYKGELTKNTFRDTLKMEEK